MEIVRHGRYCFNSFLNFMPHKGCLKHIPSILQKSTNHVSQEYEAADCGSLGDLAINEARYGHLDLKYCFQTFESEADKFLCQNHKKAWYYVLPNIR